MLRKVNEIMSIYQIVVKAEDQNTNQYRNVHHYEFFGYVPSDTELQEAIDAVDSAYKTNLQSVIDNDFDIYAYDVRRVDLGNLPTIEFTATAGSWSGTNTGATLPHQVSALITFKALTTFPRTSRCYLFGFTEDSNTTAGRVEATTITAIDAFGDDMLSLTITGQIDADKVAVTYGGTPRVVTDENDVTQHASKVNWATQRRRRSGVGI